MKINKRILNAVAKRIMKDVKEDVGYDIDLTFNDPISLNIKDGTASFHLNVTANADAKLILSLLEKGLGSED